MNAAHGEAFILIVDDDEDLRDVIASILTAQGYSVLVAASGAEALRTLRDPSRCPALMLLDLRMPDMSGEELKTALDADPRWRAIRVLVLSADADAASVARRLGVCGVIQKPVELQSLLDAVAKQLGGAAPPHPRAAA